MTSESRLPILVVDDDEPTQKLLQVLMRRHGFDSEVAANGQQAIDLLRARDFTLIILDLMMPNVAGYDVLAFLAAEGKVLPVIVCSAAAPSTLRPFDPAIVKAVIRKPFDIGEMAATVARLSVRSERPS